MGKPFDFLSFFGLISLNTCVLKLLKAFFCGVYVSRWGLNPFSFPIRSIFLLDGLLSIKFFIFFSTFGIVLTNPGPILGKLLLRSTYPSLLLLSDSRSVLATLFSPPSFLLYQTLWQIWQELSSLSSGSIRLQWVPGHSFVLGNDAADELARRGALLAPSAIPCSLFPLVSRIHSRLISDWRHTVSSNFFVTQVPSISIEELVLPRHARCVLSRLRCNGHSLLLGSYLSRIGRIEDSSCSACGHSYP